jgi:transcriptional regulator with XRE-family HTH domain
MSPRQPAAEPNEELARLVRAWRKRLRADTIPGLGSAYPAVRGRRNVTIELVAMLTGYSGSWISALERGLPENYSDDFLGRVAHALRLSTAEKSLLFCLAAGHEPIEPESSVRNTPTIQRILDAQPWPAYVNDEAWDLIAFNKHLSAWFPWAESAEKNLMRWVFTYPEARIQLHHWETAWAPQMFAQMQFAQARQPDNKRLAAVIEEILDRCPEARRFKDEALTYAHPDGDHRALHLPSDPEKKRIEIVALAPLRGPHSRLMMLIPLDA